jgi:hypothetical protein
VNLTPGSVPLTRIFELSCVNLKRFTSRKKVDIKPRNGQGQAFALALHCRALILLFRYPQPLGSGLDCGVP